jgi:hypothetical protein
MNFVNFAMLAGLAALSIPVIVHLIRSRQFQPANLGTLRFLKQAIEETRKWRRLRDFLLLLARLAMVALLVLLFARPFFADPDAAGADSMMVVMVDSSGSMSGKSLGVTNIELARENVERLARDFPRSANVVFAEFAESVRVVDGPKALRAGASGITDYDRAIDWALGRLSESPAAEKRIYLISDLQTAGLPARARELIPEEIDAYVIPISPAGAWNAAVSSVSLLTPYVGDTAEVGVQIDYFGPAPKAKRVVSLVLADGTTTEQEVDDSGSCRFSLKFDQPLKEGSTLSGLVRIESKDAYAGDNVRPFAFAVQSQYPVLLVDGAPGDDRFHDEVYFLDKALSVSGQQFANSRFLPMRTEEIRIAPGLKAIALCNVERLSEIQTNNLKAYVEGGGSVIYFLGDQVSVDEYAKLAEAGLFPGKLEVLEVHVPRPIEKWEKAHPALALFDGRESGDLRRVVFRESFIIDPGDDAQVLAELGNGTPALVEHTLGKGRVLVYANPCDRDWGSVPTQRVYVPLMKELFRYLTGAAAAGVTSEVNAGLAEERAPGVYDGDPPVVVVPPRDESDVLPVTATALRDRLGLGPEPVMSEADNEGDLDDSREREAEIWAALLFMLLVLSLAENALADRSMV